MCGIQKQEIQTQKRKQASSGCQENEIQGHSYQLAYDTTSPNQSKSWDSRRDFFKKMKLTEYRKSLKTEGKFDN